MDEEPVVSSDISSDFPSDKNITMETDAKLDFMKYFKPNVILSGEELYMYSKRTGKMIPSKGGHKDFEPDGSWLQGKKMNMIHDTLENLLSEPRIERIGTLLVGVWDREKNLVEYKRDARKFWAKMGFVDEKRKWLYPEEALYLMEINCLEVYDNDVPFSLQQAYHIFIRTTANRNQYQVYAHLRRLGYSVIRHQGRSDTTRYEQDLKLSQYTKDGKKRKISSNAGANKSCKPEKHPIVSDSANAEGNLCKRLKTENDAAEIPEAVHDNSQSFSVAANSTERTENVMRILGNQDAEENADPKNSKVDCEPISDVRIGTMSPTLFSQKTNSVEAPNKKELTKTESGDSPRDIDSNSLTLEPNKASLSCKFDENSNSCQTDNCRSQSAKSSWFGKADPGSGQSFDSGVNSGRLSPNFLSDMKKLQVLKDDDETLCKIFMYPKWNFQDYNFPNIAHLMRVTCPRPADSVTVPLFGEPLPEGNFDFDIQEYRETVMNQHKFCRSSRGPMERLEFSFVENYQNEKKAAKNWTDYKKICDLETQKKKSGSPLEFLWQGEVKPLVAPEDATSTGAILKKLQIVKHAQLHVSSMAKRPATCPEKWTVVFDVYQPNANFKKTNPGLPYFRVCVCGTDEDPPTISDVIEFNKYFADDVPINWAVVDNGEISFYIFRGVNIPGNP